MAHVIARAAVGLIQRREAGVPRFVLLVVGGTARECRESVEEVGERQIIEVPGKDVVLLSDVVDVPEIPLGRELPPPFVGRTASDGGSLVSMLLSSVGHSMAEMRQLCGAPAVYQ